MNLVIRIIRPSSREKKDLLSSRIKKFEKKGISVRFDETRQDEKWPYTAASAANRGEELKKALLERGTDAVVCARGGYGASDLLELLPWDVLKKNRPKLVTGFSDISAIQSALLSKLGWPSVHGPMPATELWDDSSPDGDQLFRLLEGYKNNEDLSGTITVSPVGLSQSLEGELFGGCFTVLTSLIGTPWLASTSEKVLFFEDLGENPARIMRGLNQWIQSGLLSSVKAVVLGTLLDMGEDAKDSSPHVYEMFARRCPVPVYVSKDFGHITPNTPIMVGAKAKIEGDCLTWQYNYDI